MASLLPNKKPKQGDIETDLPCRDFKSPVLNIFPSCQKSMSYDVDFSQGKTPPQRLTS